MINDLELPYGHDYFIENVVDPAHVPVSHHNVVGSRYSDQSLHLETLRPLNKSGFSIGVKNAHTASDMSTTTFNAPSQVLIKQPFGKEGARQYLELYSSPSRPGFSNHVGRLVIVKDTSKTMPKFLRMFTLPMPIWVNHVLASLFLNQDALFLHGQERAFTHTGKYRTAVPSNDSYSKNVLPTSADRGVMLFRGWMSKFAAGYIPFQGDTTMSASNKEVVFDVWNAHTKNCNYCLTALKRIKTVRKMTFFASALVATIRPKVLGVVGSTLTALGLSGLGLLLSKLIGMFYRFEFSHAENH
jgi:phenylpropionate dioxygenase-like ring-hydroxylating dioxygenase large terminal subunit